MTISRSHNHTRRVSTRRTWTLEALEDRVVQSRGVTGLSALTAQVMTLPAANGSGGLFAARHHPFAGVVASFDGDLQALRAGHYAAIISWGDGTRPTFGRIAADPTPGVHDLAVLGRHTYRRAGDHMVHVTITHFGKPVRSMTRMVSVGMPAPIAVAPAVPPAAATPPAAVVSTATVATPTAVAAPTAAAPIATFAAGGSTDPSGPLFAGAPTFSPATSVPSIDNLPVGFLRLNMPYVSVNKPFDGVVAEFEGSLQDLRAGLYSATIDWGDGTPITAGTIVPKTDSDDGRNLAVSGTHTYTTIPTSSFYYASVTIMRGGQVVLVSDHDNGQVGLGV